MIFDFLFQRKLYQTISKINGSITVDYWMGKKRIKIGNLHQSGGIMVDICRDVVKNLKNKGLKLSNQKILILGLGGGTLASQIAKSWPSSKITGVEIDFEMISLGKRFFDLNKIKNLTIINDDALNFIKTCQKEEFKLIFVDCYIANNIPKKLEMVDFLNGVKKLMCQGGEIVFNRLFYDKNIEETSLFLKKLEKIFSKISTIKSYGNLLIFCQN